LCVVLLAVLGSVAGCEKAPPAVIDPSKTPWLDPTTQLEGLKNEDFRIRGLSAFNLGNLGAKAADAIPQLEKLATNDPNPKVRQNAAEAIDKIQAATGQPSE
jgi:HEAT repeats